MEFRRKKCFLQKFSIILALLFAVLFSVSNVNNALAITKDYNTFSLRLRYYTESGYETTTVGGYGVQYSRVGVKYLDRIGFSTNSITVPPNSNYMAVTAKLNLVAFRFGYQDFSKLPYNYQDGDIFVDAVAINGTYQQFQNSDVNVYVTDWYCDLYNENIWSACRTFTYEVTYVLRDIPSTITQLGTGIEYSTRLQNDTDTGVSYFFEDVPSNRLYADFSNDLNSALLQQQVQQQQLIIESINNMNSSSEVYYNNYYDSVDNIEGQSTSDIPNSSSSQTTSIIGTISSFVSALQNVQTGSCQLTLPFPSFIGGDTVVNPCTGKEKAPSIVQVGSSMFLIGVFIPFAFMVLKMIYNEIRSFTNG